MLGMRQNNNKGNGNMMMSLVGIGIGAAATYGVMRGRNNNRKKNMLPIQPYSK
ncbi:hypothetical protein [Bacillus alkalicellulosilyticus]|uniref:hypothetical protein n=1 Tax=Alkalihalobacterium alkalicellulosilyticum TaxID=1912214 RepID=UPI0014827A62|nr:hypothetical protein [Bacillus alkalicellulosilyticus]